MNIDEWVEGIAQYVERGERLRHRAQREDRVVLESLYGTPIRPSEIPFVQSMPVEEGALRHSERPASKYRWTEARRIAHAKRIEANRLKAVAQMRAEQKKYERRMERAELTQAIGRELGYRKRTESGHPELVDAYSRALRNLRQPLNADLLVLSETRPHMFH